MLGTPPTRRRLISTTVLTISVGLVSMVCTAPPARATSCVTGDPKPAVEASDVVFEAVVVKTVSQSNLETRSELQVEKVYRGQVPLRIVAEHGGLAGFTTFTPTQRYLVFANISDRDPTGLFVSLCGATHALPPAGRFVQPPWSSWQPQTHIGPAKPPQSPLRSGKAKPARADTKPSTPKPSSTPKVTSPPPPGPQPTPARPPSASCRLAKPHAKAPTAPWFALAALFALASLCARSKSRASRHTRRGL